MKFVRVPVDIFFDSSKSSDGRFSGVDGGVQRVPKKYYRVKVRHELTSYSTLNVWTCATLDKDFLNNCKGSILHTYQEL